MLDEQRHKYNRSLGLLRDIGIFLDSEMNSNNNDKRYCCTEKLLLGNMFRNYVTISVLFKSMMKKFL